MIDQTYLYVWPKFGLVRCTHLTTVDCLTPLKNWRKNSESWWSGV